MAWLQVHQTLKDHRKLFDAADQLEVEPPHMMGLLVSFWLWALDTPQGRPRRHHPAHDRPGGTVGRRARKLAETLIRAGWIDENEDAPSRSTTGTSTPAS